MLHEWEVGKGMTKHNGKEDCGKKSMERGEMRSSEGKWETDKSSKRETSLKRED